MAVCMAKSGFTYVPQYSTPAPSPTAADRHTEGWVDEYGYGLGRDDTSVVATGAMSKENEDYFYGLSEKEKDAYLLAHFGDEPKDGSKRVVGCTTADQDADPESSVATKKLTADRAELAKRAIEDPAWVEADKDWATCMADAGQGGFTRQTDAEASMVVEYQPLHEKFGDGLLPEDKLAPTLKEELAESDQGLASRTPQRLDRIAANVMAAHAERAAAAGVTMITEVTPCSVLGEEVLLERLVVNLVSNAIKYNRPGGLVWMRVNDEPAMLVENTGPAVPAERIDEIFEPFRRLSSDRTDHSGGSGLGLTIARSITAAHGGAVSAEPRGTDGLRLKIDLPPAPRDRPTSASA